MKILHVITLADLGGAQSVVLNLVNASLEDGHDVFVASTEAGDMWKLLNPQATQIKIKSLQRQINLFKDLRVVINLHRIYRTIKPDVIHLHSSKIGFLGRLAFPKAKIIYTVHGFDSMRIANRKFIALEKLMQYKCKFIVGVSRYDVANITNENIKGAVCIYNGIEDVKNIDGNETSSKLFLKHCEGKKIILTIARLQSPKRFDLFCDIAHQFKEYKDLIFVWVGNSFSPENVPENVICLGEIGNAYKLLTNVEIFILTSDYEGLPISVIEALCCGVPVLASNVGGIPEILDGKNGFALPNQATTFQEKIVQLLDDDTREKFSGNARLSFLEYFTVDKMYGKYLELYNKIVNSE